MASPLSSLIPQSYTNSFLTKIHDVLNRLNTKRLALSSISDIQSRLELVWTDDFRLKADNPVTKWRWKKAQSVYLTIQDMSCHLFLLVALTTTPTDCCNAKFQSVLEYFALLKDYSSYYFSLDIAAKDLLDRTAAEGGFIGSARFVKFMEVLFPQG